MKLLRPCLALLAALLAAAPRLSQASSSSGDCLVQVRVDRVDQWIQDAITDEEPGLLVTRAKQNATTRAPVAAIQVDPEPVLLVESRTTITTDETATSSASVVLVSAKPSPPSPVAGESRRTVARSARAPTNTAISPLLGVAFAIATTAIVASL